MRDDIHKRVKLSKGWQRLIKACERDADWSINAPVVAQDTVVADVRRFMSPQFLAAAAPRQGELVGPSPMEFAEQLRVFSKSPFTNAICDVIYVMDCTIPHADRFPLALRAVLIEQTDFAVRATQSVPDGGVEIGSRLQAVVSSSIIDRVVAIVAGQGQLPERPSRQRRPLELDENLLGDAR